MAQPVALWMQLRFGQLEVGLSADDVSSYAPDVVADMTTHVVRAFTDAIAELRGHGIIGSVEDDEECAEGDVEDDDE